MSPAARGGPFVALVLRGVVWSAAGRWSQVVLGLVTLAVMTRFIGPEAYGLYALASVFVGLGDALIGGAVGEALVQRKSLLRGHEAAGFVLALAAAVAVAVVLVAGAGPIARLANAPDIANFLPALAVLALIMGVSTVPAALLQRDIRQRELVSVDAVTGVFGSVVGIALAVCGYGIWSFVAMETLRGTIRLCALIRLTRWHPRLTLDRDAYADLIGFGRWVAGIRLLQYIDRVAPRAALGFFFGASAVGYYTLGWRIYDQLQSTLVNPLAGVAMPAAARSDDDLPTLRAMLTTATQAASLIAYPAFVGVAAVAPTAVPLLLGAEWVPAVLTVQILVLIGVRSAVSAFNGGVLRGLGRADLQLRMVMVGALATVIMVPLAASWGSAAVAAVIFLRNILTWPMGARYVERLTGLPARQQLRVGMVPLVASIAMAASVFAVQQFVDAAPVLLLLGTIGMGAMIYVVVVAALAPQLASAGFGAATALLRGDRRTARLRLGALGLILAASSRSSTA